MEFYLEHKAHKEAQSTQGDERGTNNKNYYRRSNLHT
jgi:hypothetical protein